MRAVVQRVSEAKVEVDGTAIAEIGPGLVVLLGIGSDDDEDDVRYITEKIVNLRIFERDGRFDLSIKDTNGEVLMVSQFTLFGDCRKGRRPSFSNAASPDKARELYEMAVKEINRDVVVKTGRFKETMRVKLSNEGPVTILLDSAKLF